MTPPPWTSIPGGHVCAFFKKAIVHGSVVMICGEKRSEAGRGSCWAEGVATNERVPRERYMMASISLSVRGDAASGICPGGEKARLHARW